LDLPRKQKITNLQQTSVILYHKFIDEEAGEIMLKELETKSQEEIQREKATAKMFDAIERLDYEAVKAAIVEGADVSSRSNCSETALHAMLSWSDGWSSRGLMQMVFERGADPYETVYTEDGDTPLHYAARYYCKFDIPCILEYGGSSLKRVRDSNGEIPYDIAVRNDKDILEAFKKKAAAKRTLRLVSRADEPEEDIRISDSLADAMFKVAAVLDDEDMLGIMRKAIKAGVDVDARNDIGQTVLHIASTNRYGGGVADLVMLGADINAINPHTGWTPLHEAAAACSGDAIKKLLENGADPTIRDNAGETPYELAERTINEVLELLKPEPLPWLKKG
jgi:ankyrin repeat protein